MPSARITGVEPPGIARARCVEVGVEALRPELFGIALDSGRAGRSANSAVVLASRVDATHLVAGLVECFRRHSRSVSDIA